LRRFNYSLQKTKTLQSIQFINFQKIVLPDKSTFSKYTALLLVKDFNAHGALSVDNTTFMTNADVPLIALEGIIENPVNPWTGNQIKSDKENGIVLSTSYGMPVNERTLTTNKFNMLHVHTNIYDPENWSQVTIQK
jgi:hypothetical protein